MYQCTPPDLESALQSIRGIQYSRTFTSELKDLTSRFNCPYKGYKTGPSSTRQIYICSFSGEGCQSFIEFKLSDGKLYYIDGNHIHNHEISSFMSKAVLSTLDTHTIEKIRTMTRYGSDASTIRRILDLKCSPDVLYYYRRDILREEGESEVEEMIKEVSQWEDWKILLFNSEGHTIDDKHFYCAIFLNARVCQMPYADDIVITDDTMCSNHFSMHVSALLVIDYNDNTQLLGFGFLPGKSSEEFGFFFQNVKETLKTEIRLFILDRSIAQLNGIRNSYMADYIFCSKHISRNLEDNFGAGSEIVLRYHSFVNGNITEEDFEYYISDTIASIESRHELGARCLKDLIIEKDHWYPTRITEKIHLGNITTNRAEGFFGTFKRLQGKQQQTLAIVCRCMHILAERLMAITFLETASPLSSRIISPTESLLVGKLASLVLELEYKSLNSNLPFIQYGNICCYTAAVYNLPCRHILAEKMAVIESDMPLLSLNDIPSRFHSFSMQLSRNVSAQIVSNDIKVPEFVWNRTNIIARFMATTDAVLRCPELKNKLAEYFNFCEKMQVSKNIDPPKTKLPGRQLSTASQFVGKKKHFASRSCNNSKVGQKTLNSYFK